MTANDPKRPVATLGQINLNQRDGLMDKSTLNEWLQLAASLGVILSLIFVGFEIQQSREIAIADVYQQRTAILLDTLAFSVPAEAVYDAYRKSRMGDELLAEEEFAIYISLAARIAYWENNHFQFQIGLIDDEQWQASRRAIAQTIVRDPNFTRVWALERLGVRSSFAEEIDNILRETGIEDLAE